MFRRLAKTKITNIRTAAIPRQATPATPFEKGEFNGKNVAVVVFNY
ncbi:MAG: hypothetical protein FWC57_05865 [Endomicrobia bacterium]|nr:hypothetical protein [Endomicrobiia bacterium]